MTRNTLGREIGVETMIVKPNFHKRSVFSENMVAIEVRKFEAKFDKGMCILDIFKICLYEFHHEYMTPLFHEKCKIIYIPTRIALFITLSATMSTLL